MLHSNCPLLQKYKLNAIFVLYDSKKGAMLLDLWLKKINIVCILLLLWWLVTCLDVREMKNIKENIGMQ
ncbi:hypothetical protein D0T53_00520 [Dysgonomonas sp. 216]|nr:hypothetical protein [Dysgonomonas sp. 216]